MIFSTLFLATSALPLNTLAESKCPPIPQDTAIQQGKGGDLSHVAQERTSPQQMASPAYTCSAPLPLCESYTPGKRQLAGDIGLTAKAEALYWIVREHHLVGAVSIAGLKPTDLLPPALDRWNVRGDIARIEPDWDWGFRIGLCYTSPCDYWDFFLDWTSFHTSQSQAFDLLELPGWNPWGHPDTIQAARLFDFHSHWDLAYDLFTLELGRAFWIGRCLTFRPHFGIIGSCIDQSLKHLFDYEPKDFTPFGSVQNLRCDFSGGGVRSGFALHVTNGTGLGFFGKISHQLLYGKFDTNLHQTENFAQQVGTGPTQERLIASSQDAFCMGMSSVQGMLGINWDQHLLDNRYGYSLNLQWEGNMIGNLNAFSHYFHFFSEGFHRAENGHLGLMGITFGASFDF